MAYLALAKFKYLCVILKPIQNSQKELKWNSCKYYISSADFQNDLEQLNSHIWA